MPFQKGNKDGEQTQFKKGESGNPDGRPEGSTSLKVIADKILDKEITVEEAEGIFTKMTRREAMLLRIIEDALNDEDPSVRHRAAGMVMDRTEGKAAQDLNIGSKEGAGLQINVSTLSTDEKRKMLELVRKAKANPGNE